MTPRLRLSLAVGLLAATPAAALAACVAYVRHGTRPYLRDEQEVPPTGVALVLGAQVYPSGWPSAFLRARLDLAQRLVERGTVQVLLLSGDATASEHDEPAAMRDYLIARGVPPWRIVTDPSGLDTYDSFVRARRVYGLDEVVIVSQRYHLPRAVGTAHRIGLRAYGVGDDTVRHGRAWWRGVVRDQVACVKSVWDLSTRRQPQLGAPDDAVQLALSRAHVRSPRGEDTSSSGHGTRE